MSQPPFSTNRFHGALARAALLGLALAIPMLPAAAKAQSVPAVQLTEITDGLVRPVGITHSGDGTARLFIVEQAGTIRIWDGSQLLASPFLRIPVACCGERGLLGLAFHPRFDTNGYFYVHYSNPDNAVVNILDDFQGGTLHGWMVGSAATPVPPRLEPNVGPAGVGDHMMRIEADGGGGAGGRLVVFNQAQWTGDYIAEGVSQISMDLNNLGFEKLQIRIALRGRGGDIVSNKVVELGDNSGWTTVSFPIAPNEFTGLSANAVATLSSVTHFRILHNPVAEFQGPPVVATLGIDNVRAMRTVNGGLGATVISRFRVTNDPNVADPASEVVLLAQPQPFANHNGGQIAFGPDGYLYVGLGDGGSANDPQDHGQNLGDLLGTVLRLDVPADPSDPNPRLRIPADNPFVGVSGARHEIWSYGLRNPWRFSFDRSTGDLFVADVGQGAREEINFQFASSSGGTNYGWRRMEGSLCFNPTSNCNDGTLTLPVMEYSHSEGCSVTGGYRYRGRLYPSLDGVFFFGDYCSGTIWGGTEDTTGAWARHTAFGASFNISTFGEDEDGEIYVADYGGGRIYRIELAVPPPKITAPAAGTVLTAGATVTATGTGSNLSWRVDRLNDALGDIAIGTGPSITFQVPADSTALHQILVELSGDGGKDSITYNVQPAVPPLQAVASANPTTGVVPLTVQFTGTAIGGTGNYTFEWSFGDGALSMEQNPAHIYQPVGAFNAELTVRDNGGNVATSVVVITTQVAPPKITAPLAGTVLDAGATVAATGTGTNLRWKVTRTPDNLDVASATGASMTFVVPSDSTSQQQISIELTGDGGVDRIVYDIRPVAAPLQARATATPTAGTAPLTVQFMGSATGGVGAPAFEWNFGDGSPLTTEPSPNHIYQQAGTFAALLTVRDGAGGSATAEVPITVRNVGDNPKFACDQIGRLWVFSRREYACAELGRGGMPYTDDDVALATLPDELENTAWIRTASRDARRRSRSFLFLHTKVPAKVTVGFDAAAEKLPDWLTKGFTNDGKTVTLDDGRVLNLYSREYRAGWVVLGANHARGARWARGARPLQYVVAVTPSSPQASDKPTPGR